MHLVNKEYPSNKQKENTTILEWLSHCKESKSENSNL